MENKVGMGPLVSERAGYASAAWVAHHDTALSVCTLCIGWSMATGVAGRFTSGAWGIRVSTDSKPGSRILGISKVEEPIGLLYPKSSKQEDDVDSAIQRLIADNLLFLSLRLLCESHRPRFEGIDEALGPANVLLVLGPVLPKFVGRVCYSHLSKSKTIAILSVPRSLDQRTASIANAAWSEDADPPLWHDSATREWRRRGKTPVHPAKSESIDIISPVGDGVTGELGDSLHIGGQYWRNKVGLVRDIVERDGVSVSLNAITRDMGVKMPKGLALATRSAVLLPRLISAQTRKTEILAEIQSSKDKSRKEVIASALEDVIGRGSAPPDLKNILFCKAWDLADTRGSGQPFTDASNGHVRAEREHPESQLIMFDLPKQRQADRISEAAARPFTDSRAESDVASALVAIKDEFGEYATNPI